MSESGDEVFTVARDGGVFVWEWVADRKRLLGKKDSDKERNSESDSEGEGLASLGMVRTVEESIAYCCTVFRW